MNAEPVSFVIGYARPDGDSSILLGNVAILVPELQKGMYFNYPFSRIGGDNVVDKIDERLVELNLTRTKQVIGFGLDFFSQGLHQTAATSNNFGPSVFTRIMSEATKIDLLDIFFKGCDIKSVSNPDSPIRSWFDEQSRLRGISSKDTYELFVDPEQDVKLALSFAYRLAFLSCVSSSILESKVCSLGAS